MIEDENDTEKEIFKPDLQKKAEDKLGIDEDDEFNKSVDTITTKVIMYVTSFSWKRFLKDNWAFIMFVILAIFMFNYHNWHIAECNHYWMGRINASCTEFCDLLVWNSIK